MIITILTLLLLLYSWQVISTEVPHWAKIEGVSAGMPQILKIYLLACLLYVYVSMHI